MILSWPWLHIIKVIFTCRFETFCFGEWKFYEFLIFIWTQVVPQLTANSVLIDPVHLFEPVSHAHSPCRGLPHFDLSVLFLRVRPYSWCLSPNHLLIMPLSYDLLIGRFLYNIYTVTGRVLDTRIHLPFLSIYWFKWDSMRTLFL
jgi:hypothetical protein